MFSNIVVLGIALVAHTTIFAAHPGNNASLAAHHNQKSPEDVKAAQEKIEEAIKSIASKCGVKSNEAQALYNIGQAKELYDQGQPIDLDNLYKDYYTIDFNKYCLGDQQKYLKGLESSPTYLALYDKQTQALAFIDIIKAQQKLKAAYNN